MSAFSSVPPMGGVGGFHQRDGFGDGDGLVLLAGLNGQVDANFVADLDHNVLTLDPLEPFGLDANRVVAGSQVGSVIRARVIRGQGSSDAPLRVDDGYRGAGYDAAALVGDRSENASETAL